MIFAGQGSSITSSFGAASHHLDADPIRFQQVLWNLIKNAIKFTPAGGRVTVRTRLEQYSSPGKTGNGLLVEISDTGIGIEPDAMDRIFAGAEHGGTSATRRFGGLGLGLCLSRSIVEEHHGTLVAASPGPGSGATFTVMMPTVPSPLVVAETPSIAPEGIAMKEPDHRELLILLVDDNADTLMFLSTMLRRRGYDVATASDMASALQLASETEHDLIISDIELPDGNGRELMETIRAIRPTPGIALSGFGSADDIEQSLSAGFSVHLTKPVDFRRLLQVIEQVAARFTAKNLVSG